MENDNLNNNVKEAQYAFNGKMILLCSVILFIAIIVMLFVYACFRLYLLPTRHRQILHRIRSRNRRSHQLYSSDLTLTAVTRGLKASAIKSLPIFTFSKNSDTVECAVCLSEFKDGESGRVLPECNHTFHIKCIDTWFESHTTCPLCRVQVEHSSDRETRTEVVVTTLCEGEIDSRSEEVNQTRVIIHSSSFVSLREDAVGDSAATTSFRSSMSRKLSFKRIFSKEWKAPLDVEQGGEETQWVDSECNDMPNVESK